MKGRVPVIVALALTVLALGGGLRWLSGQTDIAGSQGFESCDTDPTLSGLQGYCVERRRWPELLVVAGRSEIRVYPVFDGAAGDRRLVRRDPFDATADSELAAAWTPRGLRVTDRTDADAGVLSVPRSALRSLLD